MKKGFQTRSMRKAEEAKELYWQHTPEKIAKENERAGTWIKTEQE